jgi:hypothetical protein
MLKVMARNKATCAAWVLGSSSVLSNSPFVDDANALGSSMEVVLDDAETSDFSKGVVVAYNIIDIIDVSLGEE